MWHKKFMVGLVAVGLVLGACSSTPGTSAGPSTGGSQPPSASQAPAPDQVLRVNISQEPHHLDPNLASDSISIQVLRSITRPLVYFDKDLNVVPQIATSWEISPDGTTITYHLGDFKYSDGTPIVAGDFVYSYRRLSDPRVASDYSYVLEPIVGWSALQAKGADTTDADLATLGVAAPDDKTFVITLHDPSSYFLFVSAMWLGAPLKPSFVFTEAAGYVSSGPLMLSEWKHQSNIVLLPNPYWAGPAVKIGRVEMAMINDATAALAAYEADELDVSGIPRADVNRYRTDPELSQQLHEGPALSLAYFGFNMESGPTSKSLNLRKALNEVIDKDTMLATIFSNIGSVAYSVVPPGMAGYDKTVFYPYDVAKGKTDFAAALAELGTTAGALKLKLGYNVAGSNADLAAFFQAQWKDALGIDVELVPYGDFGAYLDAIGKKGTVPDIFRLGWGADYPHPQNFLFDLFDKDSGNNYSRYNSPAFEDLLLQARSTADVTQQIALYDQAQTQLMADLPLIPQSYGALFAAVKPWVQGLQQAATDTSSGSGELFYDQVSIAAH